MPSPSESNSQVISRISGSILVPLLLLGPPDGLGARGVGVSGVVVSGVGVSGNGVLSGMYTWVAST